MQIVAAQSLEDLKAIEILATKIWNEHYIPIIGSKQVDYMLAKFQSCKAMEQQISDGYEYFMVFDSQNNMLGYLSVQVRNDLLFLSKIYLDSSTRGKGNGIKLLDFVKNYAQIKNCSTIELTVNKYNAKTIAFYHKYGFITTKEAVFDIGEGYVMDDFVMRLKLGND